MNWLKNSVNYYYYGVTMDLGNLNVSPIEMNLDKKEKDKILEFVKSKQISLVGPMVREVLQKLDNECQEYNGYNRLRYWLYRNIENVLSGKNIEMADDARIKKVLDSQFERAVESLRMIKQSSNNKTTIQIALWALLEIDLALKNSYGSFLSIY